jgi:uncharacterized protein YegL
MAAMDAGMRVALDLIEKRKRDYDSAGTPRHRPWIFMITDGGPNDDYVDVFKELQELENKKKVMTWVVGIEGYDEELLCQIMPKYEAIVDGVMQIRQRIFRLEGFNFLELLEFFKCKLGQS